MPLPPQSLIIDLEQGTVTSPFGDFSITKRSDNKVVFEAYSEDGGTKFSGGLERYSGSAIVTGWRNKEVVSNYNLTCRRADPLF
jgi:hypothetical protein